MRDTTYINRLSLVAAPDSVGGDPKGENRLFGQIKTRLAKKCGVHKTVDSYSSLHGCGCSCFFSDI